MRHQDSTPDDTLSALKIKLAAVEKKLTPAEAECDALRYQRDALLATIALMATGSQGQKA